MNVVMTGDGRFVEVQGTAEGAPFDRAELDALLALAEQGCADLTRLQQEALAPMSASTTGCSWPPATPASSPRCSASCARHAPDLEVVGLDDVTPYDEPVEDRPTFEGNALLKARAGLAATGLPERRRRQRPVRRRAQRHAGGALRALVRPALSQTTATTSCCSPSSPTCPTSDAAPTSPARSPSATPTARRRWSAAGCTAGSIRERRGDGGFGYDVVFEADEHPGTPRPS